MKAKRSVQTHGERIRDARVAKGWSTDDLARKAGYSKRTIENAEAGNPIDRMTVRDIAETLNLEYESLLAETASNQPNLFRIHLVLECDIREVEKSPHLANFVELLRRMMPAEGPIRLETVCPGSVILALEMQEADVLTLVAIFPDFHEHARAAIAETPEGRANFRGQDHPIAGSVIGLLALVEAVRELRIPTREYHPHSLPVTPPPVAPRLSPATAPTEGVKSSEAVEAGKTTTGETEMPPDSILELQGERAYLESLPPDQDRDARIRENERKVNEFFKWLESHQSRPDTDAPRFSHKYK